MNIWNITPNLHTNSHYKMWAEKWTVMQEASGLSTAPTPQGESVAKPETPLLIILSIACRYDVHVNFSVRYSKSKVQGQKHPREVVKNKKSIPKHKSIHNKQRLSTSGIGQPVPEKGRPPQAIPSTISRHIIPCYVRYQGSKIHSYIYTIKMSALIFSLEITVDSIIFFHRTPDSYTNKITLWL